MVLTIVFTAIVSDIVGGILGPLVVIKLTNPNVMEITSTGRIFNFTAEISIYTTTNGLASNRIEIYGIINGSKIMQKVITSEVLRHENPIVVNISLELINKTVDTIPFKKECEFGDMSPRCFEFTAGENYFNEFYPLQYIVRCNKCENKDNRLVA